MFYNVHNVEQQSWCRSFDVYDMKEKRTAEGCVMEEVRAHLHIRGRVQGVSFRYYTRQQAISKGVNGWVRNLGDGRVEAVVQGDESKVREVIAWCKHGPSSARVDNVWVEWETPKEDCVGYSIRATARGGQDE